MTLRDRMKLASYDRLFPSQDLLPGGGVGNLIAAPLFKPARDEGRTVFVDPGTLEPYQDQWAYLSTLGRMSPKEVKRAADRTGRVLVGSQVRRLATATSATDQRFDGADHSSPDGRLSPAEVAAVFAAGGTTPNVLQLLATYFNLATRRINAGTTIDSKTDQRLGLNNVRAASLFATATLALPTYANADRYSDAILVLDEINSNKSEVY